jgi:hypothetical protein
MIPGDKQWIPLGKLETCFVLLGRSTKFAPQVTQFDFLMQGSDLLEKEIRQRLPGLLYDPTKDPRVLLNYDALTGRPSTQTIKAGPKVNELKDSLNVPAPGQIASLNGKEVKWDGSKWVRTNIERHSLGSLWDQSQGNSLLFLYKKGKPPCRARNCRRLFRFFHGDR